MSPNPDNPGGMGEASSPALILPGSTLPCWLTEEQSQFSLTSSEPAHLYPCIQARCGLLSPVLQMARSRANAPISCPQGHLSHTTPARGGASLCHLCHQLYCAAWARGGSSSGQPLDINTAPGSNLIRDIYIAITGNMGHSHDTDKTPTAAGSWT